MNKTSFISPKSTEFPSVPTSKTMFRLFTNARLGRCTALRSTSPLAFSNKRYFAQLPESVKLADLKQAKNCFTSIPRSIIRVEGPHASKFLQGLITNNINILNKENTEHVESMYSTLLNVQGLSSFLSLIYEMANLKVELFTISLQPKPTRIHTCWTLMQISPLQSLSISIDTNYEAK